jgi:hypothetical protein
MRPLVLTSDPALQKVSRFHALADGSFAVENLVDVEPITDENHRVRNAQPSGWKGREHLVASIPMPIYLGLVTAWRAQGLSYDERQRALHKWLNDPDHAMFRTKTGRL